MTQPPPSTSSFGPYGPVFRIAPGIQTYDWGIPGSESLVARLAYPGTGDDWFSQPYAPDTPYAELWMGSHPSVPSYIKPDGAAPPTQDRIALGPYLRSHPTLLSKDVISKYDIDVDNAHSTKSPLPFLFKVLSVGKALSIQAHPDKPLAQQLHASHPEIYKDDNHKPEMAIALTPFQGFCGFRPLREILQLLQDVQELRQLVAQASGLSEEALLDQVSQAEASTNHKDALRTIFQAVMTAPEDQVRSTITTLLERYHQATKLAPSETYGTPSAIQEILTLQSQFPYDVGLLCTFLLNNVRLDPGQALFLGANEPHAYLSGEITECMAASDNVVRAGLTPKLRDTSTLISMLTYDDSPPDQKRMCPSTWCGSSTGTTSLYQPPIDEFRVLRTVLTTGEKEEHQPIAGPSVVIATQGGAQLTYHVGTDQQVLDLPEGAVAFVAPQIELGITRLDATKELVVFRAFVDAPQAQGSNL